MTFRLLLAAAKAFLTIPAGLLLLTTTHAKEKAPPSLTTLKKYRPKKACFIASWMADTEGNEKKPMPVETRTDVPASVFFRQVWCYYHYTLEFFKGSIL